MNKLIRTDIQPFLNKLFKSYGYDFRDYAEASLLRRVEFAMEKLKVRTVTDLLNIIDSKQIHIEQLIGLLTVSTTEFFRDPLFFENFRKHVVPILSTFPYPRLWIAGTSTGEEVISYAIVLKEEGLLDRCTIFATDINTEALDVLRSRSYKISRVKSCYQNYLAAGGKGSFSDHFVEKYDVCVFSEDLYRNIIASEYCLATSRFFSEVQYISCRNTLIYFNKTLQSRVIQLFHQNLENYGVLGLGNQESLNFLESSAPGSLFQLIVKPNFFAKVGSQ
jgi:chemotaxis protein methyltransferase CheR